MVSERPISSRVLALDFGKRRIGLAISDEIGITAQGLETLRRTTLREDLTRLADLAVEIADITVHHEEGKCIVRVVIFKQEDG